MTMRSAAGILALFAALSAGIGPAESGSRQDAVNAIIKSLAPIRGQAIGPGPAPPLVIPDSTRRRTEPDIEGETIIVLPDWAVDIEVYFEFDSAELTPRAEAEIAALGEALASPQLAPYRYLVAGHTDARGDDLYNLDLSWRRARAVRDYLVQTFPIEPHRLKAVGFGERRLKRPRTPLAGINRRVEVVLILPPQRASAPPVGLAPPPLPMDPRPVPARDAPPRPAADPPPPPRPPLDEPGIGRDAASQPTVRW